MMVKLQNVEFPRRGKGATGTKVLQVLGDWETKRDKDGNLLRPELKPESIEAFRKLHLSAFDDYLKESGDAIGELILYGRLYKAEHATDNSVAAMILAKAQADGFNDVLAKAIQGIVINLIRSGKTEEQAYEVAKLAVS